MGELRQVDLGSRVYYYYIHIQILFLNIQIC